MKNRQPARGEMTAPGKMNFPGHPIIPKRTNFSTTAPPDSQPKTMAIASVLRRSAWAPRSLTARVALIRLAGGAATFTASGWNPASGAASRLNAIIGVDLLAGGRLAEIRPTARVKSLGTIQLLFAQLSTKELGSLPGRISAQGTAV